MKVKIFFIMFLGFLCCIGVGNGPAGLMAVPENETDLNGLVKKAQIVLDKLGKKIEETREKNLYDKLSQILKNEYGTWKESFERYKKGPDVRENLNYLCSKGDKYIKGIDSILSKHRASPQGDHYERSAEIRKKGDEKLLKKFERRILENVNQQIAKGQEQMDLNLENKFTIMEEVIQKKLLAIWLGIAVIFTIIVVLSVLLGWYFGKQAALKYLEKAGLW